MSTFSEILAAVPENKKAVVVPGGPDLDYGSLRQIISSFRLQLSSLGLDPQDAISIALPNSLEFAVTFLSVTSCGLIANPLNPNYRQNEFEFYIEDLSSKLIIVPQGSVQSGYPAVAAARKFKAAIAEVGWNGKEVVVQLIEKASLVPGSSRRLRGAKPEDVAFVLHTSGTTGRPKAVPLLHSNMVASSRNIIGTYALSSSDTSYLVMPLFHVHGLLAGFLAPLASQGRVIIAPKFSARNFWKDFVDYKATWYTAVPTIHQILLSTPTPSPLPKIRFIRSCSSSLAPATFHALEEKFHTPVLEAYAMTEACHQMTSNSLPPGIRRPGTVGVGHGTEIAILDNDSNILPDGQEGEISVKGPNVTPGYINNPKANAECFTKGWFRTGDQGRINKDGLLEITGRIKELINRGGEKISPIELDSALLDHEAVAEAVSFGVPDEKYGEQVNAVVVLKPGKKVTEKELQAFVGKSLAAYKVPVKIFFTDVMPKTATGKIQRRVIAQKFAKPSKI